MCRSRIDTVQSRAMRVFFYTVALWGFALVLVILGLMLLVDVVFHG